MPRNTKNQSTNHGKPITDFFTRPAASHGGGTSAFSNANALQNNPTKDPLKKLSQPNPVSSRVGSQPSNSQSSSTAQNSSPPSLKRTRSPERRVEQPRKQALEVPTIPLRRKEKFDLDSKGASEGIVYVQSTPDPQRRKKPRLSSHDISSQAETDDPVPSSQSDEEELGQTKVKPQGSRNKKSTPGHQRKQTPPLTPEQGAVGKTRLNVDNGTFEALKPLTSAVGELTPAPSSQPMDQILTPPLSDLSSLPPTPVVLDTATKTAQTIANIRANAYAKCFSSPEPQATEFKDELDDSSDEEDFLAHLVVSRENPLSKQENRHATVDPTKRVTRASARVHQLPGSVPEAPRSAVGQSSSSRLPAQHSLRERKPQPEKRKPCFDPFEELLKEKRLAEKRGKGDEAFHRAEDTARQFGRNGLLNEMDDEDLSDLKLAAAASTVRDREWLINRPLTPDASRLSSDELNIDEDGRRQLFGEGGGKDILQILENDKAAKTAEATDKRAGITLWSTSDELTMLVDGAPQTPISGSHPFIRAFNAAILNGDLNQVYLILQADMLTCISSAERPAAVQSLIDYALSPECPELGALSVKGLQFYWDNNSTDNTGSITFSSILIALQRLGASRHVLAAQNWAIEQNPGSSGVTPTVKERTIKHILILLSVCAKSKRLRLEEVPDLVVALLITAIDSSASPERQREVITTLDVICNNAVPKDQTKITELAICSKVLNCIKNFEIRNKVYSISFLSSGVGSTRNMASFIANCILTERHTSTITTQSGHPPILPILRLFPQFLLEGSNYPKPFVINNGTNYMELGLYINLLGIILTNIRPYLLDESQSTGPQSLGSPAKNGEKPPTELELLRSSMDSLHDAIPDVRAAHLERTRIKATIKALSMYIHYHRLSWNRTKRDGVSSRTLRSYFHRP